MLILKKTHKLLHTTPWGYARVSCLPRMIVTLCCKCKNSIYPYALQLNLEHQLVRAEADHITKYYNIM